MFQPVVDTDKCEGCEACIEDCPEEMFEMKAGKSSVIVSHSCCYCQACIEACEQGAITLCEL